MSHGEVTLPFGNGEYAFNVARHKQLFELQDRCGLHATGLDGETMLLPAGPMEIFSRLRGGSWRAADVVQPIRLGLIGGGLGVPEVVRLMKEFVEDQPLGTLAPLAARIMYAAVYGVAGDDAVKKKRKRKPRNADSSTSPDPLNTASAQP